MCGRFTQNYTWEEVHAFLSVFGPPRNLQPHYNIAPTDTVDVIRLDKEGKRELVPRGQMSASLHCPPYLHVGLEAFAAENYASPTNEAREQPPGGQ